MSHDRAGAPQPHRFRPEKAAMLEDPARLAWLPTADVLALLELPDGATMLDFGTGTGFYAREIAHARPDVTVLAHDEQPEMLALVRAGLEHEPRPNVVPTDPETVPSFGPLARVLAINVLHELGDRALRELAALVAPGGMLVVIDWRGDRERSIGPPREHVLTPAGARDRLATAGLVTRETRDFEYHYAIVAVPEIGLVEVREPLGL